MTDYNDEELIYNLWLATVPLIGPVLHRNLLERFQTAGAVYSACREELLTVPGIGKSVAGNILTNRSIAPAEQIILNCQKHKINITTINDETYPARLKHVRDISPVLYYRGTLKEYSYTAAVVGPRRCSRPARDLAIKTTSQLTDDGVAIISGLAIGIDAYAHTAAIKKDGYTIAVLGNGLDICFPAAHIELFMAIAKRGCLISEYPPGTEPADYTFPSRNKLIAALSDEVYVIDPHKKSGSLITAEYARKYGKEVNILKA